MIDVLKFALQAGAAVLIGFAVGLVISVIIAFAIICTVNLVGPFLQ